MRRLLVLVLFVGLLPTGVARAEGPGNFPQVTHTRLRIPMRDGVTLSADVWRPVTTQLVPVILQMTPYHAVMKALDRNEDDLPDDLYATRLVKRGYAWVVVDVRGTYNSGGCWDYGGLKERQDGYDTVEWFGTVPSWSNGAVAMIGASYDGTTANAAAVEQPPHLRTIIPISAISTWYDYAYEHGARITSSGDRVDSDPPSDTPADFMFAYGVIPPPDQNRLDDPVALSDRLRPCARVAQTLSGYADGRYDDFWAERDYLALASRVQVPVLVAHGLNDWNVKPSQGLRWFEALSGTKMLVAGQWEHALPAYGQWLSILNAWLDRYLYDVPTGVESLPSVVVDGRGGSSFDLRDSFGGTVTSVALSGDEQSFTDTGAMVESAMFAGAPGAIRRAVAVSGPKIIEGSPVLHLPFRSDARGTRFAAWLRACTATSCQVIGRAFADARFRNGLQTPVALTPGAEDVIALRFHSMSAELAANETLEVWIASASLTWIVSDVERATNTVLWGTARLDLPLR